MADPLSSVRWKVQRAREQIDSLNCVAQQFLNGDFYTARTDVDRKKRLVLVVDRVEPFPLLYTGLVGEVAHQLRSSLDHMIFTLARPDTPAQEKRISFPIASTRKKFSDAKRGALTGAPRDVLRAVERVQPYHRRKLPEARRLKQLQAISNWDKHRTLAVACASIIQSRIRLEISGVTSVAREELFRGSIKPNKVLARFQVGASAAGAHIRAYPELAVTPVFDLGGPKEVVGESVPITLRRIADFIDEEVIPTFEGFF